jgi:hypothetical protein
MIFHLLARALKNSDEKMELERLPQMAANCLE